MIAECRALSQRSVRSGCQTPRQKRPLLAEAPASTAGASRLHLPQEVSHTQKDKNWTSAMDGLEKDECFPFEGWEYPLVKMIFTL